LERDEEREKREVAGEKDCRGRVIAVEKMLKGEKEIAVGERLQGERGCRGRTMRGCRG
jgi:hypothetical protein